MVDQPRWHIWIEALEMPICMWVVQQKCVELPQTTSMEVLVSGSLLVGFLGTEMSYLLSILRRLAPTETQMNKITP